MTDKGLRNELAASRATLNELLQRVDTHIQARDAKIYKLNESVSMVKTEKAVSMNNFIQLREEIKDLTSEFTQINEICSYIKGFTACYDQVEPMMQDVATISIMIKKQEEQLKELSASIMSTEQVKSAD